MLRTAALAAVVLTVAGSVARADMAPDPIGRSGETLAPHSETQVSMTAETVNIVIRPDDARIEAFFTLRNLGDKAERIEVGFPTAAVPASLIYDSEDAKVFDWAEDSIEEFSSSVDGAQVKTERKNARAHDDREDLYGRIRGWLCWPMEFEPGQERRVAVRYVVKAADFNRLPRSPLRTREIYYILRTGAPWRGPIGTATIRLTFDGVTAEHVKRVSPEPTTRAADGWTWELRDFEPKTDLVITWTVFKDANEAVNRLNRSIDEHKMRIVGETADLAESLSMLGKHGEAAAAYARADALMAGKDGWACAQGTDWAPASFWAASEFRKAGKPDEAKVQARAAIDGMERLLKALKEEKTHLTSGDKMWPPQMERLLPVCRAWAEGKDAELPPVPEKGK